MKRRLGCIGITLIPVAFVAFILWLTVFSNTCAKMLGAETYPLAGNVRHFDPFQELPQIRVKAGPGAVLTEIEAWYVRSDGTMDLQAEYKPAPYVEYTFFLPTNAPANQPPIGAGRKAGDAWYQKVTVRCSQVGQFRTVSKMGGGTSTKYTYQNEGMDVERSSPRAGTIPPDLGQPKLSGEAIWKTALDSGAPKDAVAIIKYNQFGYDFSVSGSLSFELDHDGKPRT